MKQILRYLKPYLGKLLAATVLIALSTLCDLLLPTWMSAILNGGIAARDFPAIAVRCLQMLAIAAVSLASILGGTRLSTEVVACFCADLRADVFRKVNTLSFEEFGSLGTAALVTRATHDVDTVSWVASMLSGTVATIPMLFLGGVVLAMRKDVVLSLVLLAFVPLLTLIVVLLGKRVLPLWGKSDDYIDVQNALLRERLRGIRVIRAFNTEKREHGRIADATHIMAENIIRANVSMGLLTPLATLFLNISALLIIYLGGWRMVHGVSGVSAGDIFRHHPVCHHGHERRYHGLVRHHHVSARTGRRRAHPSGARRGGHGRSHGRRNGRAAWRDRAAGCQLLLRRLRGRHQPRLPAHSAGAAHLRHRRHRQRQEHADAPAARLPRADAGAHPL